MILIVSYMIRVFETYVRNNTNNATTVKWMNLKITKIV